jgi:hypothetical protein
MVQKLKSQNKIKTLSQSARRNLVAVCPVVLSGLGFPVHDRPRPRGFIAEHCPFEHAASLKVELELAIQARRPPQPAEDYKLLIQKFREEHLQLATEHLSRSIDAVHQWGRRHSGRTSAVSTGTCVQLTELEADCVINQWRTFNIIPEQIERSIRAPRQTR